LLLFHLHFFLACARAYTLSFFSQKIDMSLVKMEKKVEAPTKPTAYVPTTNVFSNRGLTAIAAPTNNRTFTREEIEAAAGWRAELARERASYELQLLLQGLQV
jgi:hypothetical protein